MVILQWPPNCSSSLSPIPPLNINSDKACKNPSLNSPSALNPAMSLHCPREKSHSLEDPLRACSIRPFSLSGYSQAIQAFFQILNSVSLGPPASQIMLLLSGIIPLPSASDSLRRCTCSTSPNPNPLLLQHKFKLKYNYLNGCLLLFLSKNINK